jgi:hypothetical protein
MTGFPCTGCTMPERCSFAGCQRAAEAALRRFDALAVETGADFYATASLLWAGAAEAVILPGAPHGTASAILSPNTAPEYVPALCAGRPWAVRPCVSSLDCGGGLAVPAGFSGEA